MSLPLNPRTPLKRGTYARDRRTGAVVKVAEHGRGNDIMVRPAYKTDGYWADQSDFVPARDPHVWGWPQAIVLLLVTALSGWSAYSVYTDLSAHGLSGGDAFLEGALPVGLIVLVFLRDALGLNRS